MGSTPMSMSKTLVVAALVALAGCAADTEAGESLGSTREAITNGEDVADGEDSAVVALLLGGNVYCSGVLVAPNIVATAAHCVVPTPPDRVYFGSRPGTKNGTFIDVADTKAHPDFDESTLDSDIAVVGLARRAPTAPVRIVSSDDANDGSWVGKEIRLVGFGATNGNGADATKKRTGNTKVTAFGDSDFRFKATPSQTCTGDSGGPAFATIGDDEVLVGIASSGDANCSSYGRDVRVDAFTPFLQSYVHAYSAKGGGPGSENKGCTVAAAGSSDGRDGWAALLVAVVFAASMERRRARS